MGYLQTFVFLPSVRVAREVLGTRSVVHVDGTRCELFTPRFPVDGALQLLPPDVPLGTKIDEWTSTWGWRDNSDPEMGASESRDAAIVQLLLRTVVSDGDNEAMAIRVDRALRRWLRLVLDWIRILTDEPVTRTVSQRTGWTLTSLWSVESDGQWNPIPPPSQSTVVEVVAPSPLLCADLAIWQGALGTASEGAELPIPQQLMLSSRRAFIDGSLRLALFDAATATEIAIENALEDRLAERLDEVRINKFLQRFRGIEQRLTIGEALGLNFGSRLHSQLFEPRNRAAHRKSGIDRATVSVALNAANDVLKRLVELPPVVLAQVEKVG